jgi:dihydroxy-acid dehydratase
MPEAGYLPIPKKLATRGVKDMVRISDARMSGTAFGTVVLHVSPDAASGGNLALVQSGDRIRLSVKDKRLNVLLSDADLNRRRENIQIHSAPDRGYAKLYHDTVTQAPQGCDFDFLRAQTNEKPE